MCINAKKCNVITFNFSGTNFPPLNLSIDDNLIKRVQSIKLLGVIISEDLKWTQNTLSICKKVNSRMFIIAKMKSFGATRDDLVKVWTTILRPCAEFASPLWHSGLTKKDTMEIERLQRGALAIILGSTYFDHKPYYNLDGNFVSYEKALQSLGLMSLHHRREELTVNFAKQLFKSKSHRSMLLEEKQCTVTRN